MDYSTIRDSVIDEFNIVDRQAEEAPSITVSVTRTTGQMAKKLANRQAASILTGVNRAQAASCRSVLLCHRYHLVTAIALYTLRHYYQKISLISKQYYICDVNLYI